MRLDDLITRAKEELQKHAPSTKGQRTGCMTIGAFFVEYYRDRTGEISDPYEREMAELDRLLKERAGYEGFQARPPSGAPDNDDPTDRQPLG